MLVVAPHAVGTTGFYRRRRHHSTEGALMHHYVRTLAAVLFAALVVTAVAAAGYARRVPDDPGDAFTATRDVVAKFQNLAVAKHAGYGLLKDKNGVACIARSEER